MSAMEYNSAELGELRQGLQVRLDEFAGRVRRRLMLEAAAKFLAILVGLLLFTFLIDRTLRLSHLTRRGLLLALLATVGVQVWRRLLLPLRLKLDADLLAAALETKARLTVAARVATVLELPTQTQDGPSSQVMVDRAVRASHQALSAIDFPSHLDDQRWRVTAGGIAATLIFSLALVLVSPGSAWIWAARLFAGSDMGWPQRTRLEVAGMKDNVITVPRSEPFAMRVNAATGSVLPESVSIRWRQGQAPRVTALLTKFGQNDFRYDFPAVQSDVEMELTGGDDQLGPVTIHPVDRPRFVDLKLIAQHPSESQPHTYDFSGGDSDELAFLPLTRLELQFTANTPVEKVNLKSSTTRPSNADVHRISDRKFSVAWQHAALTQMEIELTGVDAGLVSVPTSVSIGLKTDRPPRISLGYSGVRQRVTPEATIPLMAEARDDFGVDRIEFQMKADITDPQDSKKVRSTATTRPVFGPATQPSDLQTEVRQGHNLSIPELKLEPGHLLSITAVATDKCYTGPQSALSRAVTFRVVRPEDLFKEIRLRQQAERPKFRRQMEEARKVRDGLSYQPSADAIAEMARQHRAIQRESNRIQTSLSDSIIEMQLNVLATDQAYDVMQKTILLPMKSLDSDLMTPQRDALDTLHNTDAAAMAAAIDRQDRIVTEMDEILKAMSKWDSFIDVLNQLNEIIRLQNQAQQKTTDLKKDQVQGIFK